MKALRLTPKGKTPKPSRWMRLNNAQLAGANFALRVFHTSPRVRGATLALLEELIHETEAEMGLRPALWGTKKIPARGGAA